MLLTNPPGHLWRDKWTALSGPLILGRSALREGFQQYNCSGASIIRFSRFDASGRDGSRGYGFVSIRHRVLNPKP